MNPHIENIMENADILTFTLGGVNVSLANALRRTIISNIPTVVFKTAPYEENKCNIIANTSRLNNEIIKQRLSCIPIHISDLDMPLKNYRMELNVENMTDTILFTTTNDFKIRNLVTDELLSENDTRNIFPPNDMTGYYIDFVRLRPKISDELHGEKIQLTCDFSISTAKEDGMFNVISTCSYGLTIDDIARDKALEKKKLEWKDNGLILEEIEFEAKNWKLLDGMRIVKKDSFDFVLQTIGVFSNKELIHKACDILINTLTKMDTLIETNELEVIPSNNTMANSYDIILVNEDYTLGKMIEFLLFTKFYEELKLLTYCGFKKLHPHDDNSIIRVAYKEQVDKSTIYGHIKTSIRIAVDVFSKIKHTF